MGVYEYIDPQTGQGYNFTIAGDAPSNTEFAQIAQILEQDRAGFTTEYEEAFGETPEDEREGIVRESLRRGYQNIKQAVGETVGTIGEESGLGFLAQYGQDTEEKARQRLGELSLEQRQRLESGDVQDFSTGLQYAGQLVGEQLPQLGLGLGAAVAAPLVGATGFLGGVAAAGIATAPVLFGNNIQRQEDEVAQGKKASVDVGDALLATFGQATLEGISDKILLGGAFRTIGKSIFTRTASRATGGATTEGLTEVGQQIMERAQAGLPIDSDDAIAEYREAAIAGGLIGGGTRATLGAFQGDVEAPTPTEVTPPPTQEVEVAPEADIEADIEAAVEEAVEEQVNAAQQREAQNAADPTPPASKAEQTQEQRDTAAAATIAETATPSVALATEEANAVNAKSRINEKLKEKAALKTQEYMPDPEPQESGTAAIESEQTGEQIEVKSFKDVDAEARQALIDNPDLLKQNEDFIREEQDVNYSPEVIDAIILQKRELKEQTIDDDFLANLNVPKQALIRREGTKKSLIGKKVSDEGVLDELRNYARISSIPEAKEGVQGFLDTLEVEDAGVRLESEGVGTGIPSGQPSVVGGRGRDSGARDTAPLAAPDARPVGTDLLDTDGVDDTAGVQRDTLEVSPEPEVEPEVTPDEQGIAAVQQLAEQATATPVDLTDAQVQHIRENPLSAEAQAEAEKRRIIRETPGGYAAEIRNALAETGTTIPPEVLVEQDELAARQAKLAEGQPKGLAVPTGPREGAIGGAETAADAQRGPVPAPVQVPPAPEMQAAPVPQEQLQAAEAQQDVAAQTRIDRVFESNRGKQPQVREYHDTQVDPRSAPEVTTAVDKEGVAELLETSDKELNPQAKAAKLFFKRFRRPVDALAEMGAVSVSGPTQNIELDFVKDFNLGKDGKPIKTKEDLTPEDMTADFAFYKGMTQKAAMDARKWVFDNLSRQAFVETRDASVRARRDTAKYNPSDAYIAVTKAARQIKRSENRAYQRQYEKDAAAYAEAKRAEATAAQVNKQLALDASMDAPRPMVTKTGEELYRVTRPIRGETAFDSYLLGMGFKKRKVTTTVERDGKKVKQSDYVFIDPDTKKALTDEELMDFYDGWIASRDMGFLLIDPVHGLDQALLPSIQNALQRGDLQFTLNAIASTSQVDRIREIAAKLGNVVGSTQIQVVDDLSPLAGRRAAGLFSPEENTIYIDANNGMNVHTILHEMFHAATSASLANPSLPTTKQLQRMLDSAREQLGEIYGTQNLDEFVAESQSNPEFRSALVLSKMDGVSIYSKFVDTMTKIMRRILGRPSSGNTAQLRELDRLVEGLLSPSPATRAAPNMLMAAGSPEGSAQLGQSIVAAVPARKKDEYIQMAGDIVYNVTDPTLQGAKNVILGSLDSRILTDVAKSKIPFAPQLNVLIRQMSGAMRTRSDMLESMLNDYNGWKRKNKDAAKVLNNLIPRSTYLRVDPSMPKEFYSSWKASYNDLTAKKSVVKEFKSEAERQKWVENFNKTRDEAKFTTAKNMAAPDADTIAQWTELNKQYKSLGKEGQAYYRQMRNFFQDTYDEIIPALRSRLEATIGDEKIRASAFEKLQDILMKESGLIRPYFPLMRKGKHRLQYTALDEKGQPEVYVEYYQNRRELERAFKAAEGLSAAGTRPEYSRADKPMNFNNVPSSSFVYDILKTMELSKGSFKDPEQYEAAVQSIVDLALDAMPERSFMQGFRRRGDKDNPLGYRGFIGDTTPTGAGGVEFDASTMLKEKGRDLNRQIVQIQAAAEIEKFRNQLKEGGYLTNPETADIARKIDKIAAFAQKPNVPNWSQTLNALGFNMTMGLNFSSAAITFFDVAMSAMPIISAEYGVANTAAAYGTATKLFANAPRERTILVTGSDGKPVEQKIRMGIAGKSAANYDLEQLPQELKDLGLDRAIKRGMDQGQFNQSLTQESLEVSRDAPLEGINKWTSAMFHHSERFNRETTLIAAYILEAQKILKSKGELTDADIDAAGQKAIETTEFTLGSTAAAGRPVWAQSGVGNILFLFKRFAVAKYYMMYKLGHESIGTTNVGKIMQELGVTEQEAQEIAYQRKVARAGLRNFLVSTGVMAGVGGMPMMGAFGVIYNMFADDDEDDFEAMLRKTVGEGVYGGLTNELLGLDVANRISMNSLLYRAPIIEKDQSPLWTLAEQLGGPVIGVTNSILRGAPDIYNGLVEGDMKTAERGLEAATPAAIRNFLKGARFYTEGAETRRGDPITEDINVYNSVMQGLGFAPQAYIQQLEFNKNNRRRQEAIDSRRTKLLRRRNMALREGDREELQRVMRMIQEYNAGLPRGAEKSRITSDTLNRSFKSFERTTQKMRGGMTYTPFMERVLQEYDKGFQLF